MTSSGAQSDRVVAALYRFVLLDDFADLRAPLLEVCATAQLFLQAYRSGRLVPIASLGHTAALNGVLFQKQVFLFLGNLILEEVRQLALHR